VILLDACCESEDNDKRETAQSQFPLDRCGRSLGTLLLRGETEREKDRELTLTVLNDLSPFRFRR
jgi:hypothetical protein